MIANMVTTNGKKWKKQYGRLFVLVVIKLKGCKIEKKEKVITRINKHEMKN